MKTNNSQAGAALLVFFVLLASSGFAFLFGGSYIVQSGRASYPTLNDRLELMQSRQALLSYSSLYPFLYGPRGAGPGHFPCPDTDSSVHFNALDWSRRAGPNPPCGSSIKTTGNLPSHINIGNKRYLVHSKIMSPVSYQVSTGVINNPVNRPVNPNFTFAEESPDWFPVLLRETTSYGGEGSHIVSEMPITNAALLQSLRPAVAAWFVNRVSELFGQACLASVVSSIETSQLLDSSEVDHLDRNAQGFDLEVVSHNNDRCQQLSEYARTCHELEKLKTEPVINVSEELVMPAATAGNQNMRIIVGGELSSLVLLMIVDEIPANLNCTASELNQATIEYSSIGRHWFTVNKWPEWFSLQFDLTCVMTVLAECSFHDASDDPALHDRQKVIIEWGSA